MRRTAILAVALCGCATPPPGRTPLAEPGRDGARDAAGPLSLPAAREAHRRAELRRHLRFVEAVEPGASLRWAAATASAERIACGAVGPEELAEIGRLLFEHEFGFADGLGSGASPRPGASGSPLRRVHTGRFGGPETTACTSCHWRGGPSGAGGLQDNSFLYGDGDHVASADARNPPPLQGVGLAEAIAAEMSAELLAARAALVGRAAREGQRVEAALAAKGVGFGRLAAWPDGRVDTAGLEGVDADLVVKPFGWKGTFATVRDFVAESLQVHFGIQSDHLLRRHGAKSDPELVGTGPDPLDPDGDGMRDELADGPLAALVVHLALLEPPVVRPPPTLHDMEPAAPSIAAPTATVFVDEWAHGRRLFAEIGCARCHVPMIVLKDPTIRLPIPAGGRGLEIDLSRAAWGQRLRFDPVLGGYPVWTFSDFKRHDLGTRNAAKHIDHGVVRGEYLTRRLWGLASSPPYLYDGSAPWLDQAIDAHQGDAAESRKAFAALSRQDKGALRVFLLSLDREPSVMVP